MREVKRYWWCRNGMVDDESLDGMLRLKTIPPESFVPASDYERTETARGHLQKRCARYKAENMRLMEAAFAVIGDSEDWQCDCAVCVAVRQVRRPRT